MSRAPYARYHALLEERITNWITGLPDNGLYKPMAYIMRLPAKRVRPAALLMSCEMFGGTAEQALDAALGVELFHNFTLMHDDIMDRAPLRRGKPTVHVKWDEATAILSGDAMLVKTYELLSVHPNILPLFNAHALAVCEGQRMDMEFEQRHEVSLEDYMEMIRKKTAMLLSCAMRIGATIGGASDADAAQLAVFGEELGLAFQLRDDLLDAFGDPDKVGKVSGGDLRAGKKTWLLIRGRQQEGHEGTLSMELRKAPQERDVPRMLRALEDVGARAAAEEKVARHERMAIEAMERIGVHEDRKKPLLGLAGSLMARTY